VSNSWKIDNNKIIMDVEIPVNTTATVFIPAKDASQIIESNKSLSQISDIKFSGMENGYAKLEIGSGVYHFQIDDQSSNVNRK
jgi:alpha-L-rhamnosidase